MTSRIDHLAQEVGEVLLRENLKLATVESCTGGWIAQAITSIAGSSEWFERGFVTYSNEAKQELVDVSAATLMEHGAVSREVAGEMAQGGVRCSVADLAVSVTGIAGPDGGTAKKPVGTVWIGWSNGGGRLDCQLFRFSGDRHEVRRASVEQALAGILTFLGKNG